MSAKTGIVLAARRAQLEAAFDQALAYDKDDVLAAYNAVSDTDEQARRNAMTVVLASREELLTRVGHLTAEREALVAALEDAAEWLEAFDPTPKQIPELAVIRQVLKAARDASVPMPGLPKISHGLCMTCVRTLYPKYVSTVEAALANAVPVSRPGILPICSACGVMIGREQGAADYAVMGLLVALATGMAVACTRPTERVTVRYASSPATVSASPSNHWSDAGASVGAALMACYTRRPETRGSGWAFEEIRNARAQGPGIDGDASALCVVESALIACEMGLHWKNLAAFRELAPANADCSQIDASVMSSMDQARQKFDRATR